MRGLVILFVHVIVTLSRLWGPGGIRSVIAESVLVKHQHLILNRPWQRAPNLRASDRFVAGLCALFMQPARLIRSAIVLKPSTLLNLHKALINRKHGILFSPKRARTPAPRDRPESSSMPLSRQSSGIPRGAARESPSKSPWLSVFPLIKTLSDASWPNITDQTQTPAVLPG